MKKKLQTAFSTRQYMLSKDFELYYYNDSKNSQVKKHGHNYYEFYFFLEGDVLIDIGGSVFPLTPGDVVLIPPKVKHQALIQDTKTPYRRFVFWISEEYCNQLVELSTDYAYLMQHVMVAKNYIFHQDPITFNEIQSKVFRILEEIHSDRYGREAMMALCIQDLLLLLNRRVYEANHPVSKGEAKELYQNLLMYIEDHLEDSMTLDQLAREFYVSKYHIAHVFKENVGMSIHQYITKKRLAACRDAILGGTGITEAYLMFGFGDYTSFYRAFKKEYGMSPKEYKELRMDKELVENI